MKASAFLSNIGQTAGMSHRSLKLVGAGCGKLVHFIVVFKVDFA
jgi:hypothetical protein